jgi:ubiquinone/menaquinone biosynthesis C-methylase UbiE
VILDISAGTGLLALNVIHEQYDFDELILNDLSEGMLEVAADRIPDQYSIQLLNDEAENIHLPDGSVDRIICLSAFHHYEDHKAVLREVRRLLKPGGSFYLLDWNRSGIFRLFNRFITWYSDDHVNTASLQDTIEVLEQLGFSVQEKEQWWWTWWNFFFILSKKDT